MPYELDDTNEPVSGPTPEQPMKPATPETEHRAAGNTLDIGQSVKIVRVQNANEANWIGITGHISDVGTGIYMVETDGPELARMKVPFYRDELEPIQPAKTIPYPTDVDAMLAAALNDQADMPGIIDLAVACAAGNTRYLSQLTSKCSVCGYEEVLELPQDASAEDMQLAMQETLLTPCPACEESIAAQIARNEPGLELLDEDGETTILDIQLPD